MFFYSLLSPIPSATLTYASSPYSDIVPGEDRDVGRAGLAERVREASISAGQSAWKHGFSLIADFP